MRRVRLLFVDLALIALASIGAIAIRDNLELSWVRLDALGPYVAITLLSSLFVLPVVGINRMMWRFSGISEYGRLVFCCIAIVMTSVLIGFATLRMDSVPRSLPILQLLLMIMALVGVRVLTRLRRLRRQRVVETVEAAPNLETVIVVGLNSLAELFIQAVVEGAKDRISIAGVIGRSERHTGQLFRGKAILGTPEELPLILKELDVHGVSVDRIVVTLPADRLSDEAKRAMDIIENGTQIKVDYFSERLGFSELPAHGPEKSEFVAPRAEQLGTCPRAVFAATQRPYWRVKRKIDAVLSGLMLLALMPVMMGIALLSAIVHGMPVMFWQQRPGRNGRPFKVYKFRSMLGAHDEHGQRLPDELRETWLGRLMRGTRMDELPQLVNILMGHMSFVGPRPLLMVDQLDQFKGRLLVSPGLTGWAQVNGGKSISAEDKMALDIWYIQNASLLLDLKILLLTAKMVVLGERANPAAVQEAWAAVNQTA